MMFIYIMENLKHLKITGVSSVSWKDAIVKVIEEASKSIDYLTDIKVIDQTAKIDGNKIIEYYATVELTFIIDSKR